jgi:hypothetical protein
VSKNGGWRIETGRQGDRETGRQGDRETKGKREKGTKRLGDIRL